MRYVPLALVALVALALPTTATARDPFPDSAGTVCNSAVVKHQYSKNYYRVKERHGELSGRNIRLYGVNDTRKSTCKHLRESNQTLKRMLAPPPQPVVAAPTATTTQAPTATAPATSSTPATGGCGDLPDYIVQRESGGDPNAVSPDGQYFGCAQLDHDHFNSGGACAGIDYTSCVNKLWDHGNGSSNWAATR